MAEIIKLPAADLFGNCPKCGGNDGVLDTGQSFWCVCHKHRFKWWISSDHFLEREEPYENAWKEHAKILSGYRKIEPLYRFTRKNR
jgi:hypothetical protein